MRSKYIKESDQKILYEKLGKKGLPLMISQETGLRIGDVVSLQYRQVYKHGGKYYIKFIAMKTAKKGVAEITKELYDKIMDKRRLDHGEYIFAANGRSGHISRQTVWNWIKDAAKRGGIDPAGISPHSYRKIFAVNRMHKDGIEAVQRALQHSNKAVTRVYAYADTIMNQGSEEPIRWCDLEMIVDYILDRLKERSSNENKGYAY